MLLALLIAGKLLMKPGGDRPNKEEKITGKQHFWRDKKVKNGYRLQQNLLDDHARILDKNNIRKATGSMSAMEDKFERLASDSFLKPGDVIGVSRKWYDHYGVYIGEGRVIHYADKTKDFGKNVSIYETDLEGFTQGCKDYFVLHFPKAGGPPRKLRSSTDFTENPREGTGIFDFIFKAKYQLFSPEETIKRAKSRLGERSYNLTRNNCEHFALWCKTGVSFSRQVDMALSI
ncbi:NC domain protein [Lachnospiraceae bacterium oral taxon 082 str. F0431]|jgi:hypothetical protein|uniref:lecithin retinol acyltransferase family protein n=1 Tax=Lachnoanaerobaculum orale TaxID=979627 RepID=UPI00024702B9|nr:lecithin retinol acyltransferase family protein [Lachnoanaerobaculum orale]EHO53687.1 NC domain protein [Lachnospiraceae bacterium oral taxon 082 str. F0431]